MDEYITFCDECGRPIYIGEYYYEIPSDESLCGTHKYVCEDCINIYRREAMKNGI